MQVFHDNNSRQSVPVFHNTYRKCAASLVEGDMVLAVFRKWALSVPLRGGAEEEIRWTQVNFTFENLKARMCSV